MSQRPPIVITTSNPNKLVEIMSVVPGDIQLVPQSLEVDEIQSLDLQAIVTHKLKQAYDIVQQPVIAEDVSAELGGLGGLPGPFVKFFVDKLGPSALYDLSQINKSNDDSITIRCLAGYYDGTTILFGEGIVQGHITAPRGENGFGFDSTFVPSGDTRTMAEMFPGEKNETSHRAQAMNNLFNEIKANVPAA